MSAGIATTYADCLDEAARVLGELDAFSEYRIVVRNAPVYLKDAGDRLPLCVVCKPHPASWEGLGSFDFVQAQFDYLVIVALIHVNSFDRALLVSQEEARTAARLCLWNPTALLANVPVVFDVEYDPQPVGVDLSALGPTLAVSLQGFRYRSSEQR